MKRIEVVITPWTLDIFKRAALRLGIAEFDVTDVYRVGCEIIEEREQLYRSNEFATNLLPRVKVEFVLFDTHVRTTLHRLLELLNPESVSVFKLEHTLRTAKGLPKSLHLHHINHPAETPGHVALGHAAHDINHRQHR
ncbi:MAG TPA: P-II family nitrogen regulator [Candidatus Binataceae bacterium]|jgi:nitrogen regulatory protein P-II 1|nr:P-II family nitrogen regulator [Candidatus Binataceae bacterium]